jgi:hypothetical protein
MTGVDTEVGGELPYGVVATGAFATALFTAGFAVSDRTPAATDTPPVKPVIVHVKTFADGV